MSEPRPIHPAGQPDASGVRAVPAEVFAAIDEDVTGIFWG